MIVNGFTLPVKLQELIESGRWLSFKYVDIEYNGEIKRFPQSFMDTDTMVRETNALKRLASNETTREQYSLTQEKYMEGRVNPNNIVAIAVDIGEEGLCLEYTEGQSEPRVVFDLFDIPQRKIVWIEVAKDFDSLLEKLG